MGSLQAMHFGSQFAAIGMDIGQSRQKARAQQAQARLEAHDLRNRAERKELDAEEALAAGRVQQRESVLRGAHALSSRRAAYAHSGVSVHSGSAVDAIADAAAWNEYDRQKIEYQANLQSWGLRYDAAFLRRRADVVQATGVRPKSAMVGAIVANSANMVKTYGDVKSTLNA